MKSAAGASTCILIISKQPRQGNDLLAGITNPRIETVNRCCGRLSAASLPQLRLRMRSGNDRHRIQLQKEPLIIHEKSISGSVPYKGGAELAARKEVQVTIKLIDKEDAIDQIRKMMDIDGFRAGDAVSRAAVIAVLDSLPETIMGIELSGAESTGEDLQ